MKSLVELSVSNFIRENKIIFWSRCMCLEQIEKSRSGKGCYHFNCEKVYG